MRKAFGLGFLLFLFTILVDLIMIFNGIPILGIFCFLQTILVFSVGIIWLIRQDDQDLHFGHRAVFIPLAVFCLGIAMTLRNNGLGGFEFKENIQEVGSLMLSRYQAALWLTAVLGMLAFVLAGTLLMRVKK